jgi:hypothetical protein
MVVKKKLVTTNVVLAFKKKNYVSHLICFTNTLGIFVDKGNIAWPNKVVTKYKVYDFLKRM